MQQPLLEKRDSELKNFFLAKNHCSSTEKEEMHIIFNDLFISLLFSFERVIEIQVILIKEIITITIYFFDSNQNIQRLRFIEIL